MLVQERAHNIYYICKWSDAIGLSYVYAFYRQLMALDNCHCDSAQQLISIFSHLLQWLGGIKGCDLKLNPLQSGIAGKVLACKGYFEVRSYLLGI